MAFYCPFFGFLETLRCICCLLKFGLEASVCMCVCAGSLQSLLHKLICFFLLIFFPCSFISYLFWFYVKKLIKHLFFPVCIQLVTEHAFEIPDNIRPGNLIKELSKVIRSVEVRTEATLHKPAEKKYL